MEQYAYIRVSTKEQHIDRQIMALKPYSISPKNIYCDYQSGKDFERPEYRKLIRKLKEGYKMKFFDGEGCLPIVIKFTFDVDFIKCM